MVLMILYDCMILYDDINLIISNTSVSHLFTGAMLIECKKKKSKTNTVQSQQIVKNVMKQKT